MFVTNDSPHWLKPYLNKYSVYIPNIFCLNMVHLLAVATRVTIIQSQWFNPANKSLYKRENDISVSY